MVDWSLAGGGGFQNALATGLQLGSQIRQRSDERKAANALSGLIANPGQDDAAFAQSIQGLPSQAIGQLAQVRQSYQTNAAQQRQTQQEQRRADLPLLGRLLEGSTDEASYQRNRQIAQEYGIDLAGAPAQFDPAWRDQQLVTMKALAAPGGQQLLSTAGKIGSDAGLRGPELQKFVMDYTRAELAKPYTGSQGETRVYQPTLGGAGAAVGGAEIPRLTDPGEVSRLPPGSQFYDPSGILRSVPGGPTQPASGGFR